MRAADHIAGRDAVVSMVHESMKEGLYQAGIGESTRQGIDKILRHAASIAFDSGVTFSESQSSPITATLESTEESRDAIALRVFVALISTWNGLATDMAKARRGVAVEAYAQADAFIAVRDGGKS